MAIAPLVVVLAGPNGAGKSTSAAHLLRGALAVDEFVNADTIAQGLSAYRPESAAVTAGRVMLDRLSFLARERRDFAFETTLAGRGHSRWLQNLRAAGYRAHLIFLALPAADLAVARVAERVRQGGHDVPEAVVRRRFVAGLRNFFEVYRTICGWLARARQQHHHGSAPDCSWRCGCANQTADQAAWRRFEEHR